MRIAIVLYNLGGPDKPADIQPFLFNLFNDPMIMDVPGPLRWMLAKLISKRRAPIAKEIYGHIGGGSPLLANTYAQADALQDVLRTAEDNEYRCFVAMRYWAPQADEVVREVIGYRPDRIILLPLYPQFSTTTVGSFLRVWQQAADRHRLAVPTTQLCCYPTDSGFVDATCELIRREFEKLDVSRPVRILFSAHGLPKKIVAGGDPYQWQVEQTAQAVMNKLAMPDIDWLCCYQSRVGPLEWIEPATEDEIKRAGHDGASVILVPLAFVSEHSETLVELDIEYRHVADEAGVPNYLRVPTVGTSEKFIQGLAGIVEDAVSVGAVTCSGAGKRICPDAWTKCICAPVPG